MTLKKGITRKHNTAFQALFLGYQKNEKIKLEAGKRYQRTTGVLRTWLTARDGAFWDVALPQSRKVCYTCIPNDLAVFSADLIWWLASFCSLVSMATSPVKDEKNAIRIDNN